MPTITRKPDSESAKGRSYQGRSQQRGQTPDASGVLSLLRNFIEQGGYAVGMMLPPERVLAESFGVGRPAIREAIKALSILDVIESRRGDGTYLKSLDGLKAGWPAKVELRSSGFHLMDLLEVRKMFEPAAAKLAATRASHADLVRIEAECVRIEEAQDWTGMAQHDLVLHTAIIDAAGNPVLTELNNALARLQRKSREITGSSAPDRSAMLRNHRFIVDAILRGEPESCLRAPTGGSP
jgi:GntR family transcriptional repressor for pyruvate dehydrogenase complex